MPKKDQSFHDFVKEEVFHQIEGITSRHMFGGYGFYKDGYFFAIIADGQLYFKVDESNKKDYKNAGSKPFIYKGHKNKNVTMSYWQLPADVMENPNVLETWVEKSVTAARKAKSK